MASLSLAMIVRDEEAVIQRILACAAPFCNEMVVVDTGSTDRTTEIAQAAGARVEHFPWCDDFSAARNFSFSCCTSDWILWLDADDVLPPETIEIGKRIKTDLLGVAQVAAVSAPYQYAYDEEGRPVLIHNRERFIRRADGLRWEGRVHEAIAGVGTNFITCPEFVVEHRTPTASEARKAGRNLRIFDQYLDTKTCSPRELYLYASELRGAGRLNEAAAFYKEHIARWPADQRDYYDEPYMARIDLCATYRLLKQAPDALSAAALAIAHDGSRAEGYALMGLTHYECENYAAAFPAFLAAAACQRPKHGGISYPAFYTDAVHDMIKDCKARLADGMATK